MSNDPEASDMKLHPEDPRLTTYVLGELGSEEAAAVEQAVAADPALHAEVAGIRNARQFLTDRLAGCEEKLLPAQRENILLNARVSSRPAGITSSFQAWLIPMAAAAVLVLATFILMWMPEEPKATTATPTPVAPAPAAPPVETVMEPVKPESGGSGIAQRGAVSPTVFPTLDLPVRPGKSNLDMVANSIRNEGRLPVPDSVRLEEILNHFTMRLAGTASIARSAANNWHPDNRDSGMSTHVATLSTELIACPWKPSATLLLVSARVSTLKDSDVKIMFRADPAAVLRYRLLGFTGSDGDPAGKLPARLPAGAVVNLAIEIEPSISGGVLGSLEWSADGTNAPPIPLTLNKDVEPSDDARFAALVCTFSQWLSGEQKGLIDAEVVAALARESASSGLPADRADFLVLIDKSLHL
jgi:anti-sigma factor ChrR (cupin superfamily)